MAKIYTHNNKIITLNNVWLEEYSEPTPTPPTPVDPLNPLGLPANTVRVRTSDGNAPVKASGTSYDSATLVSGTSDVYDVYKGGITFKNMFLNSTNIVEVLGANTSNVTSMYTMFGACSNLTTVPLFDTSSVTIMTSMFELCSSLTTVPLYNTSRVTNMNYMFYYCSNVESGALALYQQASTQAIPPNQHTQTFRNCGSITTTGAAELAQIPSGWK